jgi:hypothetical protein
MTAVWVSGVVALVFSLAFDLVPGLKEKWDSCSEEMKKWGWLLGCLLVPLAVVGLCCLGTCFFAVACTADSLATALSIGAAAYVPSQVSHFTVETIEKRLG